MNIVVTDCESYVRLLVEGRVDTNTSPQLQQAILMKMAKNGPVTERMRKDVEENIWHDSLVNWVKSFR